MRDKDGWRLSQKQARRYLDAFKMLYGPATQCPDANASPRANLEVLSAGKNCGETGNVPRGTLKPAKPAKPAKPEKRKFRKERYEQKDIVKWTKKVQTLKDYVLKIGNEGKRTIVQAVEEERMGLLPGASDLFIARPTGRYAGLWVEVKQARVYPPSKRATDHWKRQEAFQERMRAAGFAACFAFGAAHGIKIIQNYLQGINPIDPGFPPDRVGQ